jgi:hypothetical protein
MHTSLTLIGVQSLKKLKTSKCDMQDYFDKFRSRLYVRRCISGFPSNVRVGLPCQDCTYIGANKLFGFLGASFRGWLNHHEDNKIK